MTRAGVLFALQAVTFGMSIVAGVLSLLLIATPETAAVGVGWLLFAIVSTSVVLWRLLKP